MKSDEKNALSPNVTQEVGGERFISIGDILLILAENLKTVIYTPIVVCILSILYVLFIAEPVYVSSSSLLPSGGNDAISEMRGLASQFGINFPGGQESADFSSKEMYVQILESRTLANSLMNREFTTNKYGPDKSLLQILTFGDDDPEFGIDTLRDMAIKELREEIIRVSTELTSPLIRLSISSFEPQLSADLNTAVLQELDTLQKKFKLSRISEKRRFIESRSETVRKELEADEEELRRFRERNRQIQNSPALMLEEERLTRDINVQIGVFTTLKQQLEMAKIELVQSESLIEILDPPNVPPFAEKPSKAMTVIIGTLLGGIFGILLAFLWYALERISEKEKGKFIEIKRVLTTKS